MQQIQQLLKDWRESRNITTFPLTIKDDLLDELREVREAQQKLDWNNYCEELSDIAIFAFNGLGLIPMTYKSKKCSVGATLKQIESYVNMIRTSDLFQTYEILCHIITLCDELVTAKKYDFKKVINEKIKLLNSRLQDPQQKQDWIKNGTNSKWQKMRNQPKETLYIANYGKCKL